MKVILETCYLTDEEIVAACRLAVRAGAQFVKTSTGFGSGGATIEHVSLMRRTVGTGALVKASGGVRTLQDVIRMIEAGASRIGCSGTMAIQAELDKAKVPEPRYDPVKSATFITQRRVSSTSSSVPIKSNY